MKKNLSYKDSGVNIDEGNRFVEKIKQHIESTSTEHVPASIGGFAGFFDISFIKQYENPMLVSGTDGVGTKLKIAFMMEKYDTIGIDLVAMCVNDVLVTGAKPLFFLDYFATGKLDSEKMSEVVKGIAAGCKMCNTALIGGETAEMPGMYKENEFDLAGFCVGVVDKNNIIDGSKIAEGDKIIGLMSNGYHSNGYSLLRKIYFEVLNKNIKDKLNDHITVGELLLKPTKIYYNDLQKISHLQIKGIAHITGGGFYENIPRILPKGCDAIIEKNSWPELFEYNFIKENTNIEERELFRVFNMGIGMVLIVNKEIEDEVLAELNKESKIAFTIGEIVKGEQKVKIKGVDF